MSRIKVRGVICNLHGGMNASSQLQPSNFQKRRSYLRSKHSILVSLYDCSCALMYFEIPLSFVQQKKTYCSVVRHLVVRSKTVPSPCCSLEVEKNTKDSVFLPPFPTLCLLCTKTVESCHGILVMAAALKVSCFSVFTFRWESITALNGEEQTKRLRNYCRSPECALCAGTPSRQKTSERSRALTVCCWIGMWWWEHSDTATEPNGGIKPKSKCCTP